MLETFESLIKFRKNIRVTGQRLLVTPFVSTVLFPANPNRIALSMAAAISAGYQLNIASELTNAIYVRGTSFTEPLFWNIFQHGSIVQQVIDIVPFGGLVEVSISETILYGDL